MSTLMLHIYEGDDDGADMMLLIYSLKVVGAQRGSVLNNSIIVLVYDV